MQTEPSTNDQNNIVLPEAPILVPFKSGKAYWLSVDGEISLIDSKQIIKNLETEVPITCNVPMVAAKLKINTFLAYDILELFAFVKPAEFTLPTISGIAKKLDIFLFDEVENQCSTALDIIQHLILELKQSDQKSDPAAIARMMGMYGNKNGWLWSKIILKNLGQPEVPNSYADDRNILKIWNRLQEWSEEAPPPPSGHLPISDDEAQERLQELLARKKSEHRPEQEAYTKSVLEAYAPISSAEKPNVVIGEAGTGVGKTLGYLAPSTAWAEKNEGSVWISTYTRNLQKQIDNEMDRLYPNADVKAQKTVVRKGRENYLCLLNLEDAVNSPSLENNEQNAIAVGLMLRWAAVSRDGDIMGGDFPGWLVTLLGWGRTFGLADRRGECIYAGCNHYHKCFIEKSIRRSKRADIVIANHALVMIQSALSTDSDILPARYVFDEGHHLFDAADSAFSAVLSGIETAQMRRWLIGADKNKRSRARGLRKRIEDLIKDDDEALKSLDEVMENARSLPADNWRMRLYDGEAKGITEKFLGLVKQQVYARENNPNAVYSLETATLPMIDDLGETAFKLALKLYALKEPLNYLAKHLRDKLAKHADTYDKETKQKIESLCNSIERRTRLELSAWITMLDNLKSATPEDFVDWFFVERNAGRDFDYGMKRHWVDPTKPFIETIKPYAHGMLVTSATMSDNGDDNIWKSINTRSGVNHILGNEKNLSHFTIKSPFNYKEQTKIIVINDVNINDIGQVSTAYKSLFETAKGGALGLFTAINRLKQVHEIITPEIEKMDINLYSQHIDGMDISTLIDMFKQDVNSCLLGTDATRDGMDVPGNSLRMIVFDRTPWPRPDILHKARRKEFGKTYDDMLTRSKLKQAYGRLIRSKQDKGVFVILDSRLPTRLTTAFPDDVEVQRISLKEAIEDIGKFL